MVLQIAFRKCIFGLMLFRLLSILIFLFSFAYQVIAQNAEIEDELHHTDKFTQLNNNRKSILIDSSNALAHYQYAKTRFELEIFNDTTLNHFIVALDKGITDAHYYLGKLYSYKEDPNKALFHYSRYLTANKFNCVSRTIVIKNIDEVRRCLERIKSPTPIAVENMNLPFNTDMSEQHPLIDAENKTMYFTIKSGEESATLSYGLQVAYKDHVAWGWPEDVPIKLNINKAERCVALAPDGNTIVLARMNDEEKQFDLYFSEKQKNVWQKEQAYDTAINTAFNERNASLTADGQVLYFSSDRPGGFGGLDIYKSTLLPTGIWSNAVNLGPLINTEYDEDYPFIHPNGNTLYFSSKGHDTMGEHDIYSSLQEEDGMWAAPLNLGYPINSPVNDCGLVVTADMMTGYYSADKAEGFGLYDLYKIKFNDAENYYAVITGTITHAGTDKAPIKAKLTVLDESNQKINGIYSTNARNGSFIVLYNPNNEYKLIIEADGYNSVVRSMNALKFRKDDGEHLQIMLSKNKW